MPLLVSSPQHLGAWCPDLGSKAHRRRDVRKLPANHPVRQGHYEERLHFLKMEKLSLRVLFLRRLFLFDVVNGNSDCQALIALLPPRAPERSRRGDVLFRIPNDGWRSYFNPYCECCKCFNSVCDKFTNGMSKLSFKNRIKGLG